MRSRTMTAYALPILLLALSRPSAAAESGKKLALVVGNSAYSTGALRNPANDAADMGAALRGLGFEVLSGIDVNRKAMYSLIDKFGADMRDADVALFYYSGHGVQSAGENYLIPIGADISMAADVETEGVQLQRVIARMNASAAATNIVILDACRDNPFPSASRGMERGLAVVGAKPPESLIVYATEAGETANDGSGRNGIFTAALLRHICERVELAAMLREVNADVRAATGQKQKPAKYDNLTREIFLAGMAAPPVAASPSPAVPARPARAIAAYAARPEDFVFVPGGSFVMGSPAREVGRQNNETQHGTNLSPFWISKYDIIFDEYDAYCAAAGKAKPNDEYRGRGRKPVFNVSWYEAAAYCNWRSAQEGLRPAYSYDGESDCAKWPAGWDERPAGIACDFFAPGYRLPTEAEWEYAAKGGSAASGLAADAVFAGSSRIDDVAVFSSVGDLRVYPVGRMKPNALGLYDMVGNVAQWCWDWFGAYPKAEQSDPRGPAGGEQRVCRGGSGYISAVLRSSFRNCRDPSFHLPSIGFRLARSQVTR